ncbi:glutaredoxin family protein [Alkalicoccus luteus]|uniref:Glutaredoxin family protein n=1 Tax=Alkalicoccus luteus TaxID=1237094 RepID=A0A969PRJ9_9BACI|nr:glutaredoxin family protein [Alkalicoccus luteus]NJP38068.1 glutaredoxin family protein [Alkalicoccus luteus]
MADVIVYSAPDCVECSFVKQMLDRKGVSYEVRDIMAEKAYREEVQELGLLGVPVTVYEGEAVKGMNPELEALVNRAAEKST